MVIDGDVHQSSTITDTMIRGVHNMKILRPQYIGAPRGRKMPADESSARAIVGSSR
jgi:hypothetical protein